MTNNALHEDGKVLTQGVIDRHRAIASLIEELEAVDWYDQRVEAASDEELRRILAHNRDEEKEHATMLLEWLRRRDPAFDRFLRAYLFTERPITELEADTASSAVVETDTASVSEDDETGMEIGSLREEIA